MNNPSSPSPCAAFADFYEQWFEELQSLMQQLRGEGRKEEVMEKVMWHHQNYYVAKSAAAEKDPLNVFLSPWATTLERSLHWITGWRPTTAFHLIYTESSLMFESHIIDILQGLRTGDLGDLSPSQFRRVSDIQCDTVKEENAITEELSEWQDSVSEMMGPGANINDKIGRLVCIIKKADDLRLRTLRSVVGLLSPQQAIEFLIASAELLVGIRGWGLNHDRPRGR
ncbi:bZIP transcription factor bZIP132 [Glycine max]|nr:bZIP transcription factor bZIP132 [Glycine max]ABI34670.1 bZIP transcription factor bZIP132 [Glycine max]|eukprot:NP_001237999.1 bZIP transcription factor bZIP132 [Glycine max]